MAGEQGRKLVGWKEIAEYLNASLRTVQRWEQEKSLPVLRVPGSNGNLVFARSEELDRWLASGKTDPAAASTIRSTTGATGADSEPIPARAFAIRGGRGSSRSNPVSGLRRAVTSSLALRVGALAAALVVLLALGAGLMRARSARWHKNASFRAAASATAMPMITSVSAIRPKADQVIVIQGRGLGIHTYYANGDTPFIAIRDKTTRWAAGRLIPENWDEVTLNVSDWTNSQIVVTGFAGAYGQHWWRLNPGDQVEVAVWNPQTGSGPATYELTVASPQVAKK